MTQPAETFDAFDVKGGREDLTDVIYNIAPTDTPFMSGIGKANATATSHEWQTDSLAAAADNKQVEGDDYAGTAVAATTRLSNNSQIAAKVVIISGTLEATNRAGRKREMAYQLAKRGKELKRDMETSLVGVNKAKVTGNATTARQLASVEAWIATNDSLGGSGTSPSPIDGTDPRNDGTQRTLTEALLDDALKLCYDAGGDPGVIMLGSFTKQILSKFVGNAGQVQHQNNDRKIIRTAEVYIGDFHELVIVPNRFSRSRSLFLFQMDMWAVAFLRPFQVMPLAKTGDSEKRLLLVEYTLEARNEAASGGVFDLSTS